MKIRKETGVAASLSWISNKKFASWTNLVNTGRAIVDQCYDKPWSLAGSVLRQLGAPRGPGGTVRQQHNAVVSGPDTSESINVSYRGIP